MDTERRYTLDEDGFEEISIEYGMVDGNAFTATCSGGRSDCCTRVCSRGANFVHDAEAWEQFLAIEGGQVQY